MQTEQITMSRADVAAAFKDMMGPALDEKMKAFAADFEAKHGKGASQDIGKLTELARAAEDKTPKYDPAAGFDPHQGKGLNFARWARCLVTAARRGPGTKPAEVAREFTKADKAYDAVEKALLESRYEDGAALVPAEFSSEFIELRRAAEVTSQAGVRNVPLSGSTLEMGKQNTSASVAYIGESQNITPSQPTFGSRKLSLKKVAGLVAMSNDWLRQPNAALDALVRDDLVRVTALKRDLVKLRGSGTEYTPKGIENWVATGNKFNQTGSTLASQVADLTKLIRLVDETNSGLQGSAWIMSPRTKWGLFSQLDSQGNFVFASMLATGQLFGFPVYTTTQVPTNLGGGSESKVYFGRFDQFIEGTGDSYLEGFPNGTYHDGTQLISGVSADQSVIRLIEKHDLMPRYDDAVAILEAVTY